MAPGPGNPLGTRWMGVAGSLVGIQGTAAGSRLDRLLGVPWLAPQCTLPDAEWLLERLRLGTVVLIVSA